MKIHTPISIKLLSEIEKKTNILWASGISPMNYCGKLCKFLFLNYCNSNELTRADKVSPADQSIRVTAKAFLAECVRISPKKEK